VVSMGEWQGWERWKRWDPEWTVLGLAGSITHYDDWIVLKDVLPRIMREHGNVAFLLQGFIPDYLENVVGQYPSRVYADEYFRDYNEYPGVIRQSDITLCPVDPDDKFNLAKCVTGDTLVSTWAGLLAMSELGEGAWVYTPTACRKTTDGFYHKDQPVLSIETEMGYKITGTPHHKIMTPDGWRRLDQLGAGSIVTLARMYLMEHGRYAEVSFNTWATRRSDQKDMPDVTPSCPKVVIDENYGLLIGAILGDGHVTRLSTGITCDAQDLDWANYLVHVADQIGVPAKIKPSSGSRRCVEVRINSVKFNEFLAYIGVWGGSGGRTGSHDRPKHFWVPGVIWQSPETVVAAFLRGLFEADGCVTGCGAEFCTKSERLAREVQVLLLGLGITSKLRKCHNKAYSRYYYKVALRRAEFDIFVEKVGFASERKHAKSIEVSQRPHSNAYTPVVWQDTVVSIEPGTADVYDITVPEEHCYLANGFVSHNSAIKAIEGMAAGRPLSDGKTGGSAVIASPTNYYGKVVGWGSKRGIVADHDPDSWYRAITDLIKDKGKREAYQRKGWIWVDQNRSIERKWKLWWSAYQEIYRRKRYE
jgi:hypothetical protein